MSNLEHSTTCPCCKSQFDAKLASPLINQELPNTKVSLIIAVCPDCKEIYLNSSYEKQYQMGKQSTKEIFKDMKRSWSIIDSFSLKVKQGDFFNAWYYGHGLPDYIFDGVYKGTIDEVAILPFGGVIHNE